MIYFHNNTSRILGYKPKEIVGKNIFDFMTTEDVKKTKPIFNDASKNIKPIKNLENWNVKKNGDKVCVVTMEFRFLIWRVIF